METSILAKLPREIRDQIYAAVFENARIAIKVRPPRPDGKTPGGPRDTVLYHYGRDCGLSVTCRAIMTETEEIMWRSAVCEVFGSFSYENEEENAVCSVWLHHLRKVLPHKYAQNIAHLRNVWAPTVNNVGDWHIESFTESLRGFPQLRTCGFAFRLQGEPEHYIPILPATTVDRRSHHLFTRHHKRIVTKQLLPFTTGNVNGLSQSSLCPKTFLWEAICSTPEMNVQMIMQRAYQSSRDPLSYKGVWLNFTTGRCWVEPSLTAYDEDRPWRHTDDEEGFRKLLAEPVLEPEVDNESDSAPATEWADEPDTESNSTDE